MKSYLKTVVATVLVYLMILSMLPVSVLSVGAEDDVLAGEGTADSPYLITNANEFVYAMNTYGSSDGVHYSLESDIIVSNHIGSEVFKGEFNGNFHSISTDSRFAVQNNGKIYNLYYRYSQPTTEANCFCMTNNGEISGVMVYAEVVSVPDGAIFCGTNNGTIAGCATIGSIAVTQDGGSISSGFVLSNSSTGAISNCYSVATVTTEGEANSYYYEYNLEYGFSQSAGIENCYYDSTVAGNIGSNGLSTEYMKSQDFVDLLNNRNTSKYMKWTDDTEFVNNGYPIPELAYNAVIKSSKTNHYLVDPEYVSLSVDDGGEIYYTLDGSEPDINSIKYTEPILVTDTVVIKAVGYKEGISGNISQFSYAKLKGDGTESSPYRIDCEAALRSIPEVSLSACYVLTDDIVLYEPFTSLGDFYGVFDGNGHAISNLYNKLPYYQGKDYCKGLFDSNYGLIQNLNLSNNQPVYCISTFAYKNYGVINNCRFSGNILGQTDENNTTQRFMDNSPYYTSMGGFVGINYGEICNSSFVGDVRSSYANTVGGFVGSNAGKIDNCLFEGNVVVTGSHGFGRENSNIAAGFVGYNSESGVIENSSANTKRVTDTSTHYAATSCYSFGKNAGSLINCSNTYETVEWVYGVPIEWGYPSNVKQTLDGTGYKAPEHTHQYTMEVNEPTCTEAGSSTYRCEGCGDTIENLTIPAMGHDYGEEIIVNPTYETEGYTHKICKRCDYDYKYDYVEAYKVETGSCGTNATYTMDTGKGTLIISGTGAISDYKSTSTGSYPYTYYTSAPWGKYNIKSVVIEDGIESIGMDAFYYCSALEQVQLPESLTSIGKYAFYECRQLSSINLPDSITSIGDYAFSFNSNLTSIDLPDHLETIGKNAFYALNLITEIEIPDKVTRIGTNAFELCRNLKSITLPCSATLEFTSGSSTGFTYSPFYNCDNVTEVTFTKGTGSMPDYNGTSPWYALYKSLTDVQFAEGIEYVGAYTFYNCSNLETVNMPLTQPVIGKDAFKGTAYYHTSFDENGLLISGTTLLDGMYAEGAVVIPDGITEISDEAFKNNKKITSITIPDSVTTVGSSVFYGCSGLTSLTVPCDVDMYKNENSFYGVTKLSKLTMTKGTTGTMVYFNRSYTPWYLSANTMKTIILEEGINNIYNSTFSGLTNLSSVTLPDSLTQIGGAAFSGDSLLTSVVLPDNLETIGTSAFNNCSGLKEITMPASVNIGSNLNTFGNCTNIEKITMTKGTGTMPSYSSNYKCTPWYISRENLKEFILEDGITNIGSYMFYGNTSFSGFEIPDSVKSIGANAFYNCTNLKDMDLPDSLENIYGYAFYKCTGLTNLSFPTSLKKISDYAYSNCSNISSISFNDGLTEIQAYAFQSCTALDKVTLPESIEKMGNGVFAGCNNLSKAYILSRNCTISKNTFPTTTTIFGYAGSSAQTYAQNNSRAFAELYGKCSECDAWITDRVITPPTCTEKGYSTYTCDACGHTYVSDEVDAIGHDWAEGKITFSADGKTATAARICKHDAAHIETVDCTVTSQVTKPSTCTAFGDTTYTAVAVFGDGKSITDTKTITDISAIGHNWADGTVTFSADGKKATATRVCRNDPDHTETVSCTVTSSVTKAATCTEKGQTTYTAKGVFSTGDQVIDTKVVSDISALGHDWETGIITFSPDGKTANAFRVCKRDHDHTETAACSVTKEVEKPATCTEDGKTKYSAFAVFSDGTEISDSLILTDIKATGHSWDGGTVTKSPTCKKVGELTFTCKHDASHTYSVDIPIIPHNYSRSVTAPTCTEKGYTTHTCLMCGDSYVDSYTDALEHDWDEGKVTKEPTCTEKGVKTYTCKNDKNHTYTDSVNALGHDYESVVTPPTCTERGYTTHTCSRCKDSYVDTYVKALGHEWNEGKVTKEPTCTEQGLRTYTCKHDNTHTYTEPIKALGHSYESIVTPPTCTEKGFTTHTCTVCKHSFKDTYIDALGHNWDAGKITKAPTCTETGTKTFTCKHDASHTYSIDVEPLGHRYESVVTPPSCTAGGYTTYTCSVCKDTYTADYTEMLEHSYHSVVTPPSCTEGGYTTYTCTACHDSYVSDYTKALGHTWNEGVFTTKPDCENPGVKTYTCTVCGETRDETVDATGHQWNAGIVTKEPTYHTTGEKVYTCSVCGGTKTEILSCLEKRGKFVISDETVRAGDEVKVKIYIDKNPGITGLSIDVDYPEALTLTEIKYADLLSAKPTNSKDYNSPMTISWHSPGSLDEDATGLFATLTFVADINAEATDYTVRVTYKADNIIDSTLEDIPFDVENGTVSVQRPTPGDVNRDGAINMKDIVLVQQYINHWDVSIVERAADVNDDGDINMKDLVILQQYINGWEVELK